MGASAANETMGRLVLFVVILAISATLALSSDARSAVMDLAEYVYEKIAVLFGWEVSDDSQTAIDSTKALACAVDVTAYWSSQDSNALGTRLLNIEDDSDSYSIFQDVDDNWFASCVGDQSGWGIFTPTFSAITTNSGGILGKLSEWSGGEDKATGRLFGSWDGPETCDDPKGFDMCTKDNPDNAHVCNDGIENAICCEQDAAVGWPPTVDNFYCCDNGYKKASTSNTCVKMSDAELEKEADQIVADNAGTAMRFGKTAVVCEKKINAGDTVIPWTPCLIGGEMKCGNDGNVYICPLIGLKIYTKTLDCGGIGCTYLEDGTPFCAAPEVLKLQCTVKAFELPQHIDGDILDYAAKWVGAFGEPKYLVYHETFPAGIERVWTYDSTSAVLTAVALGGLFNLGGGALKAGMVGLKVGGKQTFIAILKRKGFLTAMSTTKKEIKDRLVLEYGGKALLKRTLRRKYSSSFHGVPKIEQEFVDVMGTSMTSKSAKTGGQLFDIDFHLAGSPKFKKKFMADTSLIVRSADDAPESVIDDLLQKNLDEFRTEVHLTKGLEYTDEQMAVMKSELKGELYDMKSDWNKGTLFTENDKSKMMTVLTREIGIDIADSQGMKALVAQSSKEGVRIFGDLQSLVGTKAYKAEFKKKMRLEVEELAMDSYDDIIRKRFDLEKACGTGCADEYIDGVYSNTYEEIMHPDKGFLNDNNLDTMKKIRSDGTALLKGMTGQKYYGSVLEVNKQQQVMALTLAISYFAFVKDAETDKYMSCGSGQICLHYPKWFAFNRGQDEGSTFGFGDGDYVKKEYNDLVSLAGFADDITLRMHLMSPCKTDLTVAASTDACKCETFYGQDKIWYKLVKQFCFVDTNEDGKLNLGDFRVYPTESGGCPGSVIGDIGGMGVKTFFVSSDTDVSFPVKSCSINNEKDIISDLEMCIEKEMYVEGCVDSNPNDNFEECLKNKYRDCSTGKETVNEDKTSPLGSLQGLTANRYCDGTQAVIANPHPVFPYTTSPDVNARQYSDTVPVPLNVLPNVNEEKPAETISVCENSWLGETIEKMIKTDDYNKKCITVTPDLASMKDYSEAGFGINYCAENEEGFWHSAEKVCFWGTIAVSIGVEMASMGAATPIVLWAVGSGGIACEKMGEIEGKWPKNQF